MGDVGDGVGGVELDVGQRPLPDGRGSEGVVEILA